MKKLIIYIMFMLFMVMSLNYKTVKSQNLNFNNNSLYVSENLNFNNDGISFSVKSGLKKNSVRNISGDRDEINSLPSSPDRYLNNPEGWNGHYAYSVSSGGDVNNDGFEDIIIGNPEYQGGGMRGIVYAYYGSIIGPLEYYAYNWSYVPDFLSSRFGHSIDFAGDVNGDGYGDVIIGAPFYSNGQLNEGKAFLFYGSISGLSISPAWTFEPDVANAKTGYCVSSAGDFNNDGYDDIMVGCPGYYNDYFNATGRVLVFYGSSSGPSNTADRVFKNMLDGYTGMGIEMACAGDINGDGYSDIIIGEPYWPPPPSMPGMNPDYDGPNGRAIVVYGGCLIGPECGWDFLGENSNSYFGLSVSSAKDVNNDGFDDILIGAPHTVNSQGGIGKAYLFTGSASGLGNIPAWSAGYGSLVPGFGREVSNAGDVNGDGYDDIIVGSHYSLFEEYDNPLNVYDTTIAYAFIYFGLPSGVNENYDWMYHLSQIPFITYNIDFCSGDVNGDHVSDVMLGRLRKSREYPGFFDGVELFYGRDNATPVKIASFTSSVKGNKVHLNWSTAYEINNSGFVIERSFANGNWIKAGYLTGNGNVNGISVYSFADNNLICGKYKYRLVQKDYNGNQEIFYLENEVIINIPEITKLIQNYPNPFNPVTKINFELNSSGKVRLSVYNVAGREVGILINEIMQAGYHSLEFNGSNYASGVYFYRLVVSLSNSLEAGDPSAISGQGFVETKRMMLIK